MQIGSLHVILYFTCAQGQDYILLIYPGFGRLLTRSLYTEHATGRWGRGNLAAGFQPGISHSNGKVGMIYNFQAKYDIDHQYLSLSVK